MLHYMLQSLQTHTALSLYLNWWYLQTTSKWICYVAGFVTVFNHDFGVKLNRFKLLHQCTENQSVFLLMLNLKRILLGYFYEVIEYSSPVKKKVLCRVFLLIACDFRLRFYWQIRLILHAFISKHNALMFFIWKRTLYPNKYLYYILWSKNLHWPDIVIFMSFYHFLLFITIPAHRYCSRPGRLLDSIWRSCCWRLLPLRSEPPALICELSASPKLTWATGYTNLFLIKDWVICIRFTYLNLILSFCLSELFLENVSHWLRSL